MPQHIVACFSGLNRSRYVLCKPTNSMASLTLGLLEQLRAQSTELWGNSSALHERVDKLLRELANPNLHDIPTNLPFRVEMWDRHDQHIRWVVAASTSVAIGHAALDMAIATYPSEHFTLRNGILVIRQHPPQTGASHPK
jgi:hypothetical protein